MSNTGKRVAVDELENSSRKRIYPVGRSRAIKKEESVSPEPSLPKVTFNPLSYSIRALSIPSGADDLTTIASRLSAITIKLDTRGSVAIATGFMDNARLLHLDPLGSAITNMPMSEKKMWDIFQAKPQKVRRSLPVIDWTTSKLESESDNTVKRYNRRAEALNELYGTDIIDRENAKWFSMNHMTWLPLVKAIDRMQAAHHITTLSPEATYRRLVKVEIDCLLRIVAVSQALLKKRIKVFEQGNTINSLFRVLDRAGNTTPQERLLWRVVEKESVGDIMNRKLLYAAELDSFMHILKRRESVVTAEHGKETWDNFNSVASALSDIYERIDQLITE